MLHDEKENMKLDRNFLGVPREGWRMSNNPKAHGKAPAFGRARFILQGRCAAADSTEFLKPEEP